MTKINDMPADFLEGMESEEDAIHMRDVMAAVASLITMNSMYFLAEENSKREEQLADALEEAMDALIRRKEKTVDVITCLLSLVHDVRTGGTVLDYFSRAGIEIMPLVNDKTGERV